MEWPFIAENRKERERLRKLVEGLTDTELKLTLYGDWTVAAALGHLAFWDQWAVTQLKKSSPSGIYTAAVDTHILNDTLVSIFLALPPRHLADMALASAAAVDRALEEAPEDLIRAMEKADQPWRLFRSKHRHLHMDEIEALLQKKNT